MSLCYSSLKKKPIASFVSLFSLFSNNLQVRYGGSSFIEAHLMMAFECLMLIETTYVCAKLGFDEAGEGAVP